VQNNEPIFHLGLLQNYQVIERPGTFIVSVASNITDANLYTKDDYPRYIIPLRVITSENLVKITSTLKESDEIPFNSVKHLFLSGAIFDDDNISVSELPGKGEKIVATFEYSKEDKSKILCTNLKLIDREELFYVNLINLSDFYRKVGKFT
jgi:hypothetical protein